VLTCLLFKQICLEAPFQKRRLKGRKACTRNFEKINLHRHHFETSMHMNICAAGSRAIAFGICGVSLRVLRNFVPFRVSCFPTAFVIAVHPSVPVRQCSKNVIHVSCLLCHTRQSLQQLSALRALWYNPRKALQVARLQYRLCRVRARAKFTKSWPVSVIPMSES
jgi:hypothetical protein